MKLRHLIHSAAALALTAAPLGAADWPSWRGPENNGICTETNLPTEWSSDRNVAWRLALPGSGGATPVIAGNRIFVTSVVGNDLVLQCISTDGKEQWKRTVGSGNKDV